MFRLRLPSAFSARPTLLFVAVSLLVWASSLTACIVIIDTSECYRNGDCKANEHCVRIGSIGKCTPVANVEIVNEPTPTDVTDASPDEITSPEKPTQQDVIQPEPPLPDPVRPETPVSPETPVNPDNTNPPDGPVVPDTPQPPDNPQPPEPFPETPQPPELFPETPQPPDIPQPPDMPTANTYESCDVLPCKTTDLCVSFDDENGNPASVCVPQCNTNMPSCPKNEECVSVGQGVGVCQPAGSVAAHQACQNPVVRQGKLDTTKSCAPGLFCLSLNGGEDICSKLWNGNCQTPGKSCGTNETCINLQDGNGQAYGGCFLSCANGRTCPTHLTCEPQLGDLCLGAKIAGPVPLGQICSADPQQATTQGCQAGLLCFSLQANSKGFCSKKCQNDSDCAGASNGTMGCIEVDPQTATKACVFSCPTPNPTCPAGTTCNTNVGVCLP